MSAKTAIVIGTILLAINQGDKILHGEGVQWWKVCLTYAVPYLVSTRGAVNGKLSGLARKRKLIAEVKTTADEEKSETLQGGNGSNGEHALVNRPQIRRELSLDRVMGTSLDGAGVVIQGPTRAFPAAAARAPPSTAPRPTPLPTSRTPPRPKHRDD